MIRKDFQRIRLIAFNIIQLEQLNEGNPSPLAEVAAMELLRVVASDRPAEEHACFVYLDENFGEGAGYGRR